MIWIFLACGSSATDTAFLPTDPHIIDVSTWQPGNYTTDPLQDHQPEEIDCNLTSYRVEGSQFEVQTDFCNYAHVEFLATQFIPKGQQVEVLILHSGLWAPEPATAHVALLIGDYVFFDKSSDIPASPEFFYHKEAIPFDIHQGDPIFFHIHNHGANDWKLGYFKLVID